jgi:hypothetical protein
MLYAALKRRSSTVPHSFVAVSSEKQVPHGASRRFGMTRVAWPVRNDKTGLPVRSDKTMDYYPNSLLEAATIE